MGFIDICQDGVEGQTKYTISAQAMMKWYRAYRLSY